jgi:hypothetical protein
MPTITLRPHLDVCNLYNNRTSIYFLFPVSLSAPNGEEQHRMCGHDKVAEYIQNHVQSFHLAIWKSKRADAKRNTIDYDEFETLFYLSDKVMKDEGIHHNLRTTMQ